MALGAMRELTRAGLQIPRDISIIGCDDVWIAQLSDPELTTISIPRSKIGQEAVHAVLQTDPSKGKPGREIKVATQLIIRSSTGEVSPAG
jgi:DNA-binding LacI/PurR family transcriptional regulator